MSDNKLVVNKVIKLPLGWQEDTESLNNYIKETLSVSSAISKFLLNSNLELDSLTQTVEIVLSEKEVGARNELDTEFWVDVATGEYNG
jgi:hypothetical protein